MDGDAVVYGDATNIKILTDGEAYVAVGGKTMDLVEYDACVDGSSVYRSMSTFNPTIPRAGVIRAFIKHWVDNGESHPDIIYIDNAITWPSNTYYLDSGGVGGVFTRRKCSVLRI